MCQYNYYMTFRHYNLQHCLNDVSISLNKWFNASYLTFRYEDTIVINCSTNYKMYVDLKI